MKVARLLAMPTSTGFYLKKSGALSPAEKAVFRLAGRRQVLDRLAHLLGQGKISASQAQKVYQKAIEAGCFGKEK